MSDRDTITVPADLADLDDEALAGLTESLTAEFDGLIDDGSRDVARLTALADDIDRLRGERTTRDTAAEQDDEAIAALAARVSGEPEVVEEVVEEVVVEEGEPVLASHTHTMSAPAPARPALSDLARRTARPRVPARRATVSITAAADLPGISPGAPMGMLQVAESFHDRARNLQMGQKAPVARVEVPHTHFLGTDPETNLRMIDEVIGTPEAAALVASGGWCAPSEPVFEMFDISPDTGNLFDLPGLGTKVRAGVMVPSFYGIGDAAGALWTWTEANDIDAADNNGTITDVTKPCLKIPCPTWSECRMEAEGLCVTHGNLSDRAWPELTRTFVSLVMAAHLRRISAAKIAKVLADAPAAAAPTGSMVLGDAVADLLGIIELAAMDMRSQYRLGKGRSVDVLLPDWILAVLRADLGRRAGVELINITDSQITSWFTQRGVRPQFTPDWQPIHGAGAATAWPANLTFAIWLTGSYFTLDGGTIDLGVLRDSALNETNDFTAAWSEQFYQVCRRGPQGRQYTVPLKVDGVVGCCPVV